MDTIPRIYSRLLDHNLAQKIFAKAVPHLQYQDLLSALIKNDSDSGSKGIADNLTDYLDYCGRSIGQLFSRLEQISVIPAYIAEYKRTKAMARFKVNRFLDIAYHAENFLIRSVALADQMLQFYNAIFALGVHEREVSVRSILQNRHVILSKAYKDIQKLDSHFGKFSKTSNIIIHRARYTDPDLERIEAMLLVSRLDVGRIQRYASTRYRVKVRDYAVIKSGEFDSFLREMFVLIVEVFDKLVSIFEEKYNSFVRS